MKNNMKIKRNARKQVIGKVTSNKAKKTVTVKITRRFKHPIYKKYVHKTTSFKVHDEKNECQVGDTIKIMQTRPLSKQKRWRLIEVTSKNK